MQPRAMNCGQSHVVVKLHRPLLRNPLGTGRYVVRMCFQMSQSLRWSRLQEHSIELFAEHLIPIGLLFLWPSGPQEYLTRSQASVLCGHQRELCGDPVPRV